MPISFVDDAREFSDPHGYLRERVLDDATSQEVPTNEMYRIRLASPENQLTGEAEASRIIYHVSPNPEIQVRFNNELIVRTYNTLAAYLAEHGEGGSLPVYDVSDPIKGTVYGEVCKRIEQYHEYYDTTMNAQQA